jgi:mono/diheme cytochrome c family protein
MLKMSNMWLRAAGVGGVVVAAITTLPEAPIAAAQQAPAQAQTAAAAPGARPLLQQYCIGCHNDRLKSGELSLAGVDPNDVNTHGPLLEKVVRKLRGGTMPPEGRPRPDKAVMEAFITSIETSLDRAAAARPNPGRVASRRLNRAEYVNAIRDLIGLDVNGAELLPSDMAGFGFDNNADVLSITPSLMSRYIAAATKISRLAVASPDNRPLMQVYKVGFEDRSARSGEDMPFGTRGGVAVRHNFPLDGEYVFKLRLKRNGTVSTIDGIEEDAHQIEVRIDHALVKRFTIGGKLKGRNPGLLIAVPEDDKEGQAIHDYRQTADDELEVRLTIKAGARLVTAAFTDSAPSPENMFRARVRGGPGDAEGNAPGVDMLYISGPFAGSVPADTPSRQVIFTCRPAAERDEAACARRIIAGLARRAYRRPVTDADVTPLLAIFEEGRAERDFDAGIERAIEALLSSPKFLLRVEQQPPGTAVGTPYRVSDLELASRLSFFLWRSVPDDELIDVAAKGQLKTPAVLAQQVKRMLVDKRASRFMKDFSEQWLEIRNLQALEPDTQLYPAFDDSLRKAMAKETELFFESQVRQDRPIKDLLRADYTFLNEQLARHYGINDVFGSHFRRVTLTDERRHGLLGQGSVLTVTSYANRTSVVLRGKWVLENLLGSPPPPPTPNVPPLKENDGGSKPTALRERMEEHRNNPVCASCHSRMDPLGFALEHFDPIGQWRETDSGAAINATITLADREIDSPKAFREALLTNTDEFVRTVTEKLLTYALGRGLEHFDAPTVRAIQRDSASQESRWSALILGIVRSAQFQMRTVLERPATAPATVASR